ncbi:axonemal dynein light intermediate polypeptide 1-like [Limanda limanda]|uniref:axonemal dynein light intermediate polypeptide 1-like n=1 Tax=Limanda limanda TaxID=27771 RepID=UPI0029C6D63B|nr:axonemal dynein light intermediate polypeptide 1-like [Limanda limanda]
MLQQQQNVSSATVSRLDVVHLQELLNTKLLERQAKETGICPLRRELYSQCLDELIRQVTMECDERGLLLSRIKDEIELSLSAYKTLYETGVASGMRKFMQAEQGKGDMEQRVSDLENESHDLRRELDKEKAKCDEIENYANQKLQVENERLTGEIESLKRANEQLKVRKLAVLQIKQQ